MKIHNITMLMFVLNALLVYRLAILITRDKITEAFRKRLDREFKGALIEYFFYCPWCVSVYLGAGATVLTWLWWPVWQWICLGAACSAVAGFLGEHS